MTQTEPGSMLEKLARAVRDARALPGTKPVARLSDVDRRSALAMLQVLRNPTPEMIEVGAHCASTTPLPNTALIIWQAMLDAAMEGGS